MTTTHAPIITVWHNNVGRPIPYRYGEGSYEGRSGIGGGEPEKHWLDTMERFGHAITTVGFRPANHHMIGVGIGHDDADWCESRFGAGSMAAWYENECSGPAYSRTEQTPHLAAIMREREAAA